MGGLSTRDDIFAYLTDHQDDLKRRHSLERIAVIGSIARNDYTDESDVDVQPGHTDGTVPAPRPRPP